MRGKWVWRQPHSQGVSSPHPRSLWGGETKDPGNEVGLATGAEPPLPAQLVFFLKLRKELKN